MSLTHFLFLFIINFITLKEKKRGFLSLGAFRIPKQYMKALLSFSNKVKLT